MGKLQRGAASGVDLVLDATASTPSEALGIVVASGARGHCKTAGAVACMPSFAHSENEDA